MQKRYYPWLIWGLAASAFFIEYLARVAPGVMVDHLMHDFQVHALALGSLSAFFYYAYVGMQIPVGLLFDRFSVRWLLTSMITLCALSCFLFIWSHTLFLASLARFMMGLGAAFAFVGVLKIVSLWFPSYRFGLLAGLTQAIGMLGAALGQMPMAYLVGKVGWRTTLQLIAWIMLALAVTIAVLVRDQTLQVVNSEVKTTKVYTPWSGLCVVLKNPQSWWNALFAGLLYAPTAALAELWGIKFFSQTYQLSNEVAAMAVGLIFIGWGIGSPLIGWLSDRLKRRRIILILSALLSLLFASLILFVPHLPLMLLFTYLFLYGVANTGVATAYAVASEINPLSVSGTSVAFANMASIMVGASFQPLIGALLEKNWTGALSSEGVPIYYAADFHSALLIIILSLVAALSVAFFIRETYSQRTP